MKYKKLFLTIVGLGWALLANAKVVVTPMLNETGQAYTSYREDFSPAAGRSNPGQWFYSGNMHQQFQGEAKKTGEHYALTVSGLVAAFPVLGTQFAPEFLGDYINKKVVGLSVETKVASDYSEYRDRPMSLLLLGSGGLGLYRAIGTCLPKDTSCVAPSLPSTITITSYRLPQSAEEAVKNGWRAININDVQQAIRLDEKFYKLVLSNVQAVNFVYAEPKKVYFVQEFSVETTAISIFTKSPKGSQ